MLFRSVLEGFFMGQHILDGAGTMSIMAERHGGEPGSRMEAH